MNNSGRFSWYYEGDSASNDTHSTLADALTAAIEDAADPPREVLVGPMVDVDPASLVDADDILELAKDRIADLVDGGTAWLSVGLAESFESALADLLRSHVEPDPAVYCDGTPALPIHYVEGAWTHGIEHEDGDIGAAVWFHPTDGWHWTALGEHGTATDCGDAMRKADAVLYWALGEE